MSLKFHICLCVCLGQTFTSWTLSFYPWACMSQHKTLRECLFNPRRHKGWGGVNLIPPLDFFGLKFLFLDQLPKALAQLFFVC